MTRREQANTITDEKLQQAFLKYGLLEAYIDNRMTDLEQLEQKFEYEVLGSVEGDFDYSEIINSLKLDSTEYEPNLNIEALKDVTNILDEWGRTCLMYAINKHDNFNGPFKFKDVLTELSKDKKWGQDFINTADVAGRRALDYAIQLPIMGGGHEDYSEIVSLLLEAGAEVNYRSKNGMTPLIRAAQVFKDTLREIAIIETEQTSNPWTYDKFWGVLSAQIMQLRYQIKVIKMLLDHGADQDLLCIGHSAYGQRAYEILFPRHMQDLHAEFTKIR